MQSRERVCRVEAGTYVPRRRMSACAARKQERTNRAAVKYGCIVWKGNLYVSLRSMNSCTAQKSAARICSHRSIRTPTPICNPNARMTMKNRAQLRAGNPRARQAHRHKRAQATAEMRHAHCKANPLHRREALACCRICPWQWDGLLLSAWFMLPLFCGRYR